MAGRNDRAIADALQALAIAIKTQTGGVVEYQGLDRFQRNNLPAFHGGYDLKGAENWLKEFRKIFRVMQCPDKQQVLFATHILTKEAEYWWENTYPRLERVHGAVIP